MKNIRLDNKNPWYVARKKSTCTKVSNFVLFQPYGLLTVKHLELWSCQSLWYWSLLLHWQYYHTFNCVCNSPVMELWDRPKAQIICAVLFSSNIFGWYRYHVVIQGRQQIHFSLFTSQLIMSSFGSRNQLRHTLVSLRSFLLSFQFIGTYHMGWLRLSLTPLVYPHHNLLQKQVGLKCPT